MSATAIRTFTGLTSTAPPIPCQIGREQVFVLVGRDPEGNGPLCWAYVVAGDGRFLIGSPLNLRSFPCHDPQGNPVPWEDCFGASLFVSRAAPEDGGGTIKFACNVKPSNTGNGNDRCLVIASTGMIPAVTQ
jgi:hypothetical protein